MSTWTLIYLRVFTVNTVCPASGFCALDFPTMMDCNLALWVRENHLAPQVDFVSFITATAKEIKISLSTWFFPSPFYLLCLSGDSWPFPLHMDSSPSSVPPWTSPSWGPLLLGFKPDRLPLPPQDPILNMWWNPIRVPPVLRTLSNLVYLFFPQFVRSFIFLLGIAPSSLQKHYIFAHLVTDGIWGPRPKPDVRQCLIQVEATEPIRTH